MSKARILLSILVLLPALVLQACESTNALRPPLAFKNPPAEITQPTYLHEIVRYLYRWQFDESEIERIVGNKQLTLWICRVDVPLDPGDHSVEAEIFLPQEDMSVSVKKADYTIEETGMVVRNPGFVIQKVTRGEVPSTAPNHCAVIELDTKELRDYLFRTRNQHDYPDARLVEHLRSAVRQEAVKLGLEVPAAGEQIVHVAPLSPVANEVWVYWENGHKLIYFGSDNDLTNSALWESATLTTRIFDLDDQVVVSSQEAEGSNRYLTRYQVSRTLFNCLVLGERMTLLPPATSQNTARP